MVQRTILIVDDQQTVLFTYQRLLRRHLPGTEVLVAGSAAAATDLVRERPVHVVLSDYWMPGEDGLEFLARVRELRPDARRAVFTAYVDPAVAHRALEGGLAEDFLAKDLEPALLVERVGRLLQDVPATTARP